MSARVEVEILGRRLALRTEEPPERVEAAAALVRERLGQLQEAGLTAGTDRLLILAALDLAGEVLELRDGKDADRARLLEELDALVSQVEGLANAPLR